MAGDPYRYFRIEARELLDGLSQGVLALERGQADPQLVQRLLRLAHTLKGASRVVKQAEIADHAHAVEGVLAPHRDGRAALPRDRIEELLRRVDAIAAKVAALEPQAQPSAAARPEEPFETVRVEIEEVDALLEGVFEAGVQLMSLRPEIDEIERTRRMASVLADQLRASGKAGALAEEITASLARLRRGLAASLDQADIEITQVRDAADRLRLLPAAAIFPPLERAARDAAQSLQKRVDFRASGGENRLDAHVLGALRDAMLHVVRNAVAHGVETEPERVSAGKPPAGRIEIQVERRGNLIAFACRDDGRGIDVDAVRRAAMRRGLITASEAASLGPEEAVRLLLKGGVTTASPPTEMSGRGIGLDVVRETAARLKGDVTVRTERGRGTRLEICVPVSLSSLAALGVESAGVSCSVPLDSVQRTLRVGSAEIAPAADSESILFEGSAIPFLPLARALGRPPEAAPQSWSAVVVQSADGRAAVGVDRLLGTTRVVMRPLPAWVQADPVVLGASLDAEGQPALLLDPAGLVSAARLGRERPPTEMRTRPPVLVIDDSLTTRMLEQSILESAGYSVELAVSAEEALRKARDGRYSLFLVDIEMPGMDGFEFLARARDDAALRSVPSILVTSRSSAEDRRRGEEAGARAYVVKSEFDQQHLLHTIRELIG